jgi:peptidoglycan/LPS O-acetylase OafA/YrhL
MIKNRNFGLDLIRAISIILVVVSHFAVFNIELGVWGVEIFFVLSGFLIGQIIIKDFTTGITFKKIIEFWKRRWFRTLPLYYAVILIKFIFFDNSLGIKILAYVFFLQNNFVGIQFLPVSWSLVIEEWFYLLLPILLFIFFKNGLSKQKFLIFLILLIGFIFLLRLTWVLYTNRPFEAIRPNFPFRFDTLLFGVLLAHLKISYNNIYLKMVNPIAFFIGFIVMVFLIFDLGSLNEKLLSNANSNIWYRTGWFSVFSMSIFLLVPFIENSTFIKKTAKWKPYYLIVTYTSILTYSIYLIHIFVFQIELPFQSDFLTKATHVLLIYFFSFLIYKYYEHPVMNLRDRKKSDLKK